MSREIKFRAWMPKTQSWYRGGAIHLTAMIGNQFGLSEANGGIIKLQQYTGLQDKNGVEIYEGDIVKDGWSKHAPSFTVEWTTILDQGDMQSINAGVGFNVCPPEKGEPDTYEVIGNIYENPELLETGGGDGQAN